MLNGLINKKPVMIASIFAVVFILFSVFSLMVNKNKLPELVRSVVVSPVKAIQAINLVDHNNEIVNVERFKHRWTFVFFGYTNCPDVCPATMAQFKLIKKNISYADTTQFFFVSVDPQRDSVEHLSKYMTYFDPSFIGVTGEQNDILNFEEQLGAYHRLGNKNSHGDYDVQHSGDIFLIDSNARLVAKFQPPMDINEITKQFAMLVSLKNKEAV